MSKRNKLAKFAELSTIPFVFQCFDYEKRALINHEDQAVDLRGKWSNEVFKNDNPIVLELACGRGEYTLALAKAYPDKNFIGVDIKGARIHQGARFAIEDELNNVAFVRTRIELIDCFFAPEEVSEVWITFPDPFLKDSKSHRRLTSENFLKTYQKILTKDAICHLKTDNTMLYEFSLESLTAFKADLIYHDDDIYSKALYIPELEYKTYYEKQHLSNGLTIKYIQFKLT